MNSKEIEDRVGTIYSNESLWLKEIAFQLAKLNEKLDSIAPYNNLQGRDLLGVKQY